MKITGIIPARYASTRFPGKPMVLIEGKTMIRRVYEQASSCSGISDLWVATDDERIERHVKEFGGRVIMTSGDLRSGTERCNEAVNILFRKYNEPCDVVINIQGDEPFIHPEQISQVADCFEYPEVTIATLVRKITSAEELADPNVVKVVMDIHSRAIYFSRAALPYLQNRNDKKPTGEFTWYKHVGIYGYSPSVLREITSLAPSALEQAESLEQLRWIENGYSIRILETEFDNIAVDIPDDLLKFTNRAR